MARPKKIVDVQIEEVAEGVTIIEVTQSDAKVVAMVRSEEYPEPRSANVHPSEVEEWKKYGWTKK